MTLKEFLSVCTMTTALVDVFNDGENTAFATFSAQSVDSLLTTIQNKTVDSFTVQSPSKIKIVLS